MRRLRKQWPPRNVSPDNQDARSWKEAADDLLATADLDTHHARSAFDNLDKRKLRAVMYQEQGNLCVYCERRIKEGNPTPRIDHWRPLSEAPDLALCWDNLYLSCASEATCDCRKGDTVLRADSNSSELPWPINFPYDRCVGFTSLGEVYVRTDAPLNDAQRRALTLALGAPHDDTTSDNGILNLNHPALVAARAAAVNSERSRLERDHKNKTATRSTRIARAKALREHQPLPEFISVRVRWLERSLGSAR